MRNTFLKTKTDANKKAYNKQRNYCVHYFRREKKSFFNNLNKRLSIINVSGKLLSRSFQIKIELKTKLHEDKTKFVLDNNLVAETFTNFFANIVPSLGLQSKDDLLVSVEHIEKFEQHPSIIAIIKHKPNKSIFSLSGVVKQSIESLIKTLDSSKAIQKDNIPTKIIKADITLSI